VACLADDLPAGCVVLATSAAIAAKQPPRPRVQLVELPGDSAQSSGLPLLHARTRRMRKRRLATLFDVFQPDLVLLDPYGPEAEVDGRLLRERAVALGAAVLEAVRHDPPGDPCRADSEPAAACESCRERTRTATRQALAKLARARKQS